MTSHLTGGFNVGEQITARFLTSHSLDELIVSGHPLLTGLTIRY